MTRSNLKSVVIGVFSAVVLPAYATMTPLAIANQKQIGGTPGKISEQTGTVEAIEAAGRTVTLKKPDGTFVTTVAGPDIKRFEEIKIGDKVTVRYYENVVVRLRLPGEPVMEATAGTPSGQVLPGGTRATQRTIAATIAAIDMAIPSITFTGPNGWKYTSKVEDKAALTKAKIGDKVEIVWTDALLVSLAPSK